MNPWKFLKLMWYMRDVPGGQERGNPTYVADAFIRAGRVQGGRP
jgi:hypothetical protein